MIVDYNNMVKRYFQNTIFSFEFAILIFSSFIIFLIQSNVDQMSNIGLGGLFVPDSISLANSVELYWNVEDRSWEKWRAILGVVIVYYLGGIFGQLGYAVINIFLLSSSFILVVKSVKRNAITSPLNFSMLAVLSNFYLIEVLLFPNKEIPLIFLTSLYAWLLISKKNIIWVFVSIIFVFLIRDGYAIILFAATIFIYLFENFHGKKILVILSLMTILMSLVPIAVFQGIDTSLSRNVAVGEIIISKYDDFINGQFGYFFKIIGNTFNLATRPQFVDCSSNFHLLSIGYWQFGILIIAGIVWAIKSLFEDEIDSKRLAVLILIVLIGISYSSFVQPRYLMPMIYFFSNTFVKCKKCAFIAVLLGVVGPVFFSCIDQLPGCQL